MKRLLLVLLVVALLLALPLAPAGATPPQAVEFEVPTTIPGDGGPSFGPFTATGPAVVDGIICASGDTIDVFGKASGGQPKTPGINFQIVKLFTCDDGSGEFFVKLQVRVDFKGDNFQWTILGGTRAYEDLHGSGDGIGIFLGGDPAVVLDLYSGKAHID